MDTVIDAGRYDGALGIVTAIAAVKVLKIEGKLQQFPRPIEIIAFSDEEGIRFQTTFLGSSAIAGTFQPKHLKNVDARGISIGAALRAASHLGTLESLSTMKYEPTSVWGYVELHIEQGPVLEAHGLPLGVVEAIAGQTRLAVRVEGSQGHAGTVPMSMRKDPMIAAAQSIVAIENICTHPEKGVGGSRGATAMSTAVNHAGAIVCTVGEIHSWPGASNVIPGEVVFTIDVRSKDDSNRETNVVRIESEIRKICRKRGVGCVIERKHEANAIGCAPGLSDRLNTAAFTAMRELPPFRNNFTALEDGGFTAPTLVSGAGHDAMAMASLTQVGMLFLRCTGGVSHSPAEHVQDDDIWAGSLALLRFMEGVLGDLSQNQSA
jgi:allantoate deiminase